MTDVEQAQKRVEAMQEKLNDENKDLATQQKRVDAAQENLTEAENELKKETIKAKEEELNQLKNS